MWVASSWPPRKAAAACEGEHMTQDLQSSRSPRLQRRVTEARPIIELPNSPHSSASFVPMARELRQRPRKSRPCRGESAANCRRCNPGALHSRLWRWINAIGSEVKRSARCRRLPALKMKSVVPPTRSPLWDHLRRGQPQQLAGLCAPARHLQAIRIAISDGREGAVSSELGRAGCCEIPRNSRPTRRRTLSRLRLADCNLQLVARGTGTPPGHAPKDVRCPTRERLPRPTPRAARRAF